MFNIFRRQEKSKAEVSPGASVEKAFEEFSRVFSPQMIERARTAHTAGLAQEEGRHTARDTQAQMIAEKLQVSIHRLVKNVLAAELGMTVTKSPEYKPWLATVSAELGMQLAAMQSRLNAPAPIYKELRTRALIKEMIEESPEATQKFNSFCRYFNYDGAIMHNDPKDRGNVKDTMHGVIASAIMERAIGQNAPLSFAEIKGPLAKCHDLNKM